MSPPTTNEERAARAERAAKALRAAKTRRASKSGKPAKSSDGASRSAEQTKDHIKSDPKDSEQATTASAAQQNPFVLPMPDPSELAQALAFPPLDDKELLALWLGATSLVHDPTQPFRDDHRAGQEVFKKLSLGEPVTAAEDLRYMDDFTVKMKK
ncbi:uncharacterized protein PAN0_002c1349 [Moesziomyces antarcticus]|uniref:Uncharacterized protein n=1 Tax=Pseudozyma antarctica TaxID=84753 RepID=A0A5C3FIU5_PSEA2|nr:uncharacterized protein PAN0_002c1349 [Moesziomyces antarcticus]GAK63146.1 hypothetical protein PAN0_002c1349 [Moesziomyces antarcticus]SPO43369.1 uncharacterized protein PSANT_01053 [Moesziomyces antarcticus]